MSNPGQQSLYLYQDQMGGASSPAPVARSDFQNLAPDQTVALSWSRNWDASSPSEGEFPPSFRAQIMYDPDIYMDGNDQNDDCGPPDNNRRNLDGRLINDRFRSTP